MYKRLREARNVLKLSQEFVAKQLHIPRTAIVAIEAGKRSVSVEELDKFSKLYGISADELMYGKSSVNAEAGMFARAFSELSEIDRKEIMNLIDFKKRYKEQMND